MVIPWTRRTKTLSCLALSKWKMVWCTLSIYR